MSSVADENSPPRQDPVERAKRQSTLLDSPSRVTRSQLRRLSNAPVEAPMSPKPTVSRRRSTLVSESRSDAGADDEVSSIHEEPDAVKPAVRSRRSTRRSFAETADDGPPTIRGSKLTSIKEDSKLNTQEYVAPISQEDSKPVTRRTRASLKASQDPEPEMILPPARRTRRSSVSSVSSITSSVAASPRRQTRARKTLSAVPSPTFSEVSTMSEVPEISPNVGRRRSISGSGLNTSSNSITPRSAHVSPAMPSSGKKSGLVSDSARSSPVMESSPMSKISELSSIGARQLLIEDSTTSKRASLGSSIPQNGLAAENDSPNESESMKPSRRSHGRLSLSSRKSLSPLKFVESPLEHPQKKSEDKSFNEEAPCSKKLGPVEDSSDMPEGRSSGRFSLSSNKSSPASKVGVSPELPQSRRGSMGRLSLPNKSSPAKPATADDESDAALSPTPFVVLTKSEDIDSLNSSQQSSDDISDRPIESSRRSSWKSSPLTLSETSLKITPKMSALSAVNSSDASLSEEPPAGSVSPERKGADVFGRSSTGRLSLLSKIPSPTKSLEDSQLSHNESRRSSIGRLSISSNKSTPTKLSINEDSSEIIVCQSRRSSVGRLSLSSNKSSPAKLANMFDIKDTEPTVLSTQLTETEELPTENSDLSSQSSSSVADSSKESTGNDSLSEAKEDGDNEKNSSSKYPNFLNTRTVSKRASTGNLDPKTSDVKLKTRASVGPLINPLVSYMISDDKEAASDASDDEAISDGQDSEEMKISPIKQDDSLLKRRSLTPDKSLSEPERQLSPNNPFEKSTIFDEMDESFGTNSDADCSEISRKSPKLNSSQKSDKNSSTGDGDMLIDAADITFTKKSDSQSPSNLVSSLSHVNAKPKLPSASMKVYKDAAFLLSGGNVSDFDDDDSDDNQWQPVFSPSTKSKKELRMEKKARKKAEKLAKTMAKLKKVSSLGKDDEPQTNISEAVDSVQSEDEDSVSPTFEDEVENAVNIQFSSSQSSKRKSMEANGLDVDEVKPKKRKSLLQSDTVASPRKSDTASPDKTVETEVLSSKKRKSMDTEIESSSSESIKLVFETEVEAKPNKQKSTITESDEVSPAATLPEDMEDKVILSEKKSKKKKKVETSQEAISETVAQISDGCQLLKKKKKQKLANGTDSNAAVDNAMEVVKKKKKVKKEDITEENMVPEDLLSAMSKKKKKLKKTAENVPISCAEILTDAKKKKKKLKTTAQSEPSISLCQDILVDSTEVHKKKKLKKKVSEPLELNTESSGAELLKKKKKQKLINESDVHLSATVGNSMDVIQKKKKKKIDREAYTEENIVPEVQGKEKKKIKKRVELEGEHSEPINASDLKKKKKTLVEVDDNASTNLITKKKLKKKDKKQVESFVPVEAGDASDSDDAPTSVSFSAGKHAALAEFEAAAKSIKKQKELKRQKLQSKLEKIKEEKLAKMQRLKKKQKHSNDFELDNNSLQGVNEGSSVSKISFADGGYQKSSTKRLPAELLESLCEQPPTKLVKRPDGSKERVAASALSAEDQELLEKKRAKKLARKMEKQKLLESDYVPLDGVLGATRFGVVPLRNIMLAKKLQKNRLAEEAVNFRQQSLFGNRIRRTPISSVLSHQDKLKASGKDRLVNPPK